MESWTKAPCQGCGESIDIDRESYRKVTDRMGVTRYFHTSPEKDCWNMQSTPQPSLQLVRR